ncbi:MAG: prepilin-type N-terminal cleavage/methylation domain-containing protein [Desulfobacterales bacterium]|nr:prepilin-type N-terminal cleavage/methylation domain-containing protein [Desulfobacterales bacterium]
MKSLLKKEAGLTLIELMIVLVLSAVVTASIYATFIAQQKSYATQTRVSDMQQNARAALTLMERDLRMAGSNVGSSFTIQDFLGNNVNAAITIVNNTSPTPDQITVAYAAQVLSTVSAVSDADVTLADDAIAVGFGITGGRQFIAFETVNGVYTIQSIVGNTITLTGNPPAHLADIGASGARAFLVKAITYQVDTSIDPSTGRPRNTLERVASDQIGTAPDVPEDLWDDIGNYITDLQVGWVVANQLLQVTLTSQDTDTDGVTVRTRQHQAVINVRNL